MANVFLPSYGSMGVNDQLLATPPAQVFRPDRALGPTFQTTGTTPLPTLPGMPDGMGLAAASPRISLYVALGLAASLIMGVWLMSNVHYR